MELNKYNNLLELFNFQLNQQNPKSIFLRSLKNSNNKFSWQQTFECMQKLSDEHPEDMVIYKIAEELQEIFNTFRTHVRKTYPDEYKKI